MKAGIESGPVALCVLRFFKSLWTPFQSILISGMFGVVLSPLSGMLVRSSSVNTDLNCSGDDSHKQPCLFSDPVELILYMYIMLLFSCY